MVTRKVLVEVGSIFLITAFLVIVVLFMLKKEECPSEVSACLSSDHLFHPESGQCFLKGDDPEGICGRNMAVLPDVNCHVIGVCECNYEKHERLLLYHARSNQCYFIYEQGFCPDGQVVVLSPNYTTAYCERDVCADEKRMLPASDHHLMVPLHNKCHRLFSTLNETYCNGELRFWKNEVNPSCSPPKTFLRGGSLGAIPALRCRPGSFQAVNGLCQPPVDASFD